MNVENLQKLSLNLHRLGNVDNKLYNLRNSAKLFGFSGLDEELSKIQKTCDNITLSLLDIINSITKSGPLA